MPATPPPTPGTPPIAPTAYSLPPFVPAPATPPPSLPPDTNPILETHGPISMPAAVTWAAAWLLVLGVLWGISRTNWGRPITYYSLWLMVVLSVVTHYGTISDILNKGNISYGQS